MFLDHAAQVTQRLHSRPHTLAVDSTTVPRATRLMEVSVAVAFLGGRHVAEKVPVEEYPSTLASGS